MSDVYEFAKANEVQGFERETPYKSKNWQSINDINGGAYPNNGICTINFDLSSLYNSEYHVDVSEAFVAVPICYTMAYVSNVATGAIVQPGAGDTGAYARLGLKNGYFQLLQTADIKCNSKSIEDSDPYQNVYIGFKLLSTMSQDDYNSYGYSMGMGRELDSVASLKYNAVSGGAGAFPLGTGPIGGNSFSNCAPYAQGVSNGGDVSVWGAQNGPTAYNKGYFSRLQKCTDISANQVSNIYGSVGLGTNNAVTIQGLANANTELRSTFQISQGTNPGYLCWNDTAIIRLQDIFDSMKKFPLVKKLDATMRLYLNVGAVAASVIAATPGAMMTSFAQNTFTSSCPLLISNGGAFPLTTVGVVAGISVAKAAGTNMFGVNLALSGQSHPMPCARIYYPQVELKPTQLIAYSKANRSKLISYTSYAFSQATAVTPGGSYTGLCQAGLKNIRGVILIPFLSSSTNGSLAVTAPLVSGITTFSPTLSPFDCAPLQTGPLSLINLQVKVGGKNILDNTLSYSFENFIEQIALYEKTNGSTLGISCGLISQYMWENAYRPYYVDCSRGTKADQANSRSVEASFQNNTLQTIDVMIFVEYYNELILDTETGVIKKL